MDGFYKMIDILLKLDLPKEIIYDEIIPCIPKNGIDKYIIKKMKQRIEFLGKIERHFSIKDDGLKRDILNYYQGGNIYHFHSVSFSLYFEYCYMMDEFYDWFFIYE